LFLFVELGNIRFLDWIWIWVLYIWNLQWGYGLMSLLNTKFLVRIERGLNYQIKVFFFFHWRIDWYRKLSLKGFLNVVS
jgi:hypothetical protein